ncbi:unnamed protein product [Sphagnum balticum]
MFRTTLVIDKNNRDAIYRRVEELPDSSAAVEEYNITAAASTGPLRPEAPTDSRALRDIESIIERERFRSTR